jgi:hypothetical protein
MIQCPYRIKDANGIGWFNCQLEDAHDGRDHVPPSAAVGHTQKFEGKWHRPGESGSADPHPASIVVPSIFQVNHK